MSQSVHNRGAAQGSEQTGKGRGNRRSAHGGKRRDRASSSSARRQKRPAEKPQELDEATGLPLHLLEAVRTQYDAGDVERILEGWGAGRRVTLRANALRGGRDEVASALDAANIGWEGVPWYPDAFVLAPGTAERDVWELDAYKEGRLYLQSLSSMLPPLSLAPRAGADILDMCAAPGGKTTQIAALASVLGGRAAHVTACELSMPRAERLEHNLHLLGADNVQVMRTDARKLDSWFSFDQVLLDAPCTGSGTVRAHDARAARHLTPKLADGVERSQRALVDKALEVLKPGGVLVYSTCSIIARENEDVVAWALARHGDCELVDVGLPSGVSEGPLALPTLPCRLDGAVTVCPTELYEGFFVCRIRKRG